MQSTFDRDDERRVLRVASEGAFDLEALSTLLERMHREDAWSYALIYDMRGLTTAPTAAEAAVITDRVAARSTDQPRGPLALLVRDGELYRLACAYFALGTRHGRDIRVFRFQDEVDQWLESLDL